jgi:P4 family phage/plasmid primase-like protien
MQDDPADQIALVDYIDGVQFGRWHSEVERCRKHLATGDTRRYSDAKRSLPGVTVSAACLTRSAKVDHADRAISHSGWLQADFDGKDNGQLIEPSTVKAMREELARDPHVGFVFQGPSGSGLKALVCIDGSRHRDSWQAASVYFLSKYGLKMDPSTKDVLRLCFVSDDPDAVENHAAVPIKLIEREADTASAWVPPTDTTAEDIEQMLKYVAPRPAYDEWLRIASAVWSVLSIADGCRVLNDWSPEEKPGEYASKHLARLKQIGIGTLVHYAQLGGFDARAAWQNKRWAGRIRFGARTVNGSAIDAMPQLAPVVVAGGALDRARVKEAFDQGEKGDARLWSDVRRGLRVYSIQWQKWMVWEGGVWRRDDAEHTRIDISDQLGTIYGEFRRSIEIEMVQIPCPDGPKKDSRSGEIKHVQKRINALSSKRGMEAVEDLARTSLAMHATEFDAKPHVLSVENGVIDFTDGMFREHHPLDYLTHQTPIKYDPDATAPKWQEFLNLFLGGDQELIDFVARCVGYSMTGFVHEDCLFFLYGKGANGKSTFIATLGMLLGNLMTSVPMAALLSGRSDNNFDYQKANMEGRRVVVTDEIPEGRRLQENHIKALVGGDAIAARRPYEQPYTFQPTHKLWMVGNHKPEITGTDHGIWRRMVLVPWTVTIAEEKRRSRHEVLAEFRAELPGILNWAIDGYIQMMEIGGLKPPDAVRDATAQYRTEEDHMRHFIADKMLPDYDAYATLKEIRQFYLAWCEDSGETPRYKNNRIMAAYMRDQGYKVESCGKGNEVSVVGFRMLRENDSRLAQGQFKVVSEKTTQEQGQLIS